MILRLIKKTKGNIEVKDENNNFYLLLQPGLSVSARGEKLIFFDGKEGNIIMATNWYELQDQTGSQLGVSLNDVVETLSTYYLFINAGVGGGSGTISADDVIETYTRIFETPAHNMIVDNFISSKGQPSGLASLDSNGLIYTSQLPSYVDDVIEVVTISAAPIIGETGKIYVDKTTNKTYRWSGSTYIYITSGAVDSVNNKTGIISLTTSDIPDSLNKRYVTDVEHTTLSNTSGVNTGDQDLTNYVLNSRSINGYTLTSNINLSKADIGLSYVDNTSDVNKPVSTAQSIAIGLKQDQLVSGENIKTLNSQSLVGVGNISVEPTISSGTTSQYWRGDKTFQTLDKTAVGLSNVDNTSDLNKPISTEARTIFNTLDGNGVVSGIQLSINGGDNTKFDISSGVYHIISNGNLNYPGITAVSLTAGLTSIATYVALDSSGNIIQQTSPFLMSQRRQYVMIGALIHSNHTIINVVNNLPDVAISSSSQLFDLMDSLKNFNIDGNIITANGANLSINKSIGKIFKKGVNFSIDATNPHVKTLSQLIAPSNIRYRLSDGTEYSDTNVVSLFYESSVGVRTAIPINRFSIQRIYLFSSNIIRIQYGADIYNTISLAEQAIKTEIYTTEQNIAENALFRSYLIVKGDTVSLIDSTTAKFIPVDRFGELPLGSVGGTSTLQQAYNNSETPEITTSTLLGAFSIKRGSVADTDNVIEILNGSNTITTSINANGLIKSNKIQTTLDDTTFVIQDKNFTGTSGTKTATSSNATITQSGTAGYKAFDINVTETTIGSGNKYLLSTTVNTAQNFGITNSGILVLPKESGRGIKIDTTTPDYGWRDLVGQVVPRASGGPAPALSPFRGTNLLSYAFAAADVIDNISFHLPHDYAPGTDLYLHIHWGHNGTAISGNLVINWYVQYAKGHQQALFNSELNITQTIPVNITTYPRWQHNISEFQLTNVGGDATHLDRNLIEVDGLLLVSLVTTTIPTITGGVVNNPYFFTVDIHYQSTGIPTKNKAPNFYL